MRLQAAVAIHGAATLLLTGLLVQLPMAPAPQFSVMMWPLLTAALFALSAWVWPESRRDLSQAERGVIWMRSHPSRWRLQAAVLLAMGTAPFWHWLGMPVGHSMEHYHYFSVMAVVNLFAALWLLMEGFCQLREWSLRYRRWMRRMCAWPVTALLYVVIVPVVAIFVCFGLVVVQRFINHEMPETTVLPEGLLRVAALLFTPFLHGVLSPESPAGWLVRALLLMVLPLLLAWECMASLVVLLSKPGQALPQGISVDDGEEDEGESPMQAEEPAQVEDTQ